MGQQDGLQKTKNPGSRIVDDVYMIMNSRKAQWMSMGWMDGWTDARMILLEMATGEPFTFLFLSLSKYTGNQGLSR